MDFEYSQINFKGFEQIREQLKTITRYSNMETMFYRTNDYSHSKSVFYLLKETIPKIKKIYPKFNEEKALIMAAIHDDTEIIIGDFQAGNKAKLNKEQVLELETKELNAINEMSLKYPKTINGFNYEQLLLEIFHKNTIEANIVKYLDRFDAFGESCHEIFAGNICFATQVENEYGLIELPTPYYITRFNDYETNYPLISELIESNQIPFLKKYMDLKIINIVKNKKPHTKHSLSTNTNSLEYNFWKKVLIKHNFSEKLLNKVE